MGLLSGGQLASMRAAAERALGPDCEVLRWKAQGRNEIGSYDDGPGDAAPVVVGKYPSRVVERRPTPRKDEAEPGAVVISEWVIKLPLRATFKMTDRLRVGGVLYEPLQQDNGRTDATLLSVVCHIARESTEVL